MTEPRAEKIAAKNALKLFLFGFNGPQEVDDANILGAMQQVKWTRESIDALIEDFAAMLASSRTPMTRQQINEEVESIIVKHSEDGNKVEDWKGLRDWIVDVIDRLRLQAPGQEKEMVEWIWHHAFTITQSAVPSNAKVALAQEIKDKCREYLDKFTKDSK